MPFFKPSPHLGMQAAPALGHAKPVSMVQVELHPSPLLLFLSSHCSVGSTMPLLQTGLTQTEGPRPAQVQPASCLQLMSQPFPGLGGSHSSPRAGCTMLS